MNNDKFPLNVRLLAILLGCSLVVLIAVFFLHRMQVKNQAGFFLEKARAARKTAAGLEDLDAQYEEIIKASTSYQRYGRLRREDNEIAAEHGLMLVEFAEKFAKAGRPYDAVLFYRTALVYLEKVLREEPERRQLRRNLVRSLFELGQSAAAMNHIILLVEVPPDAEGLQKLFDRYDLWPRTKSLGGMDQGGGRKAALEEFLLPDHKSVNRDRLVSWLRDGNHDDLWMVMEDAELLAIYGTCQVQLNQPELAEKPLEKAASLAPDRLETYPVLVGLLQKLGREKDADYWISEAVNANPDSFEANRIRGEYRLGLIRRAAEKEDAVEFARGALWDATESIHKAIEQAADKADAKAPSSEATKKLKAAFDAAMLAMPREDESTTPAYRDRLIDAARQLKSLDKETTLHATKEADAVRDALVLAAQCEVAASGLDGKGPDSPHLKNARIYATAVDELFPGRAATYLILASIERAHDQPEKAIEWLRRGTGCKQDRLTVMWQLANLLIDARRLDEAREIIKQMTDENAPDVYLEHLQAMIHFAEEDWLPAKKGFERVLPELTSTPESALQVNLFIAKCCAELGLIDQQREALSRATMLDRTSIRALLDLAKVEAASGQLTEAIEDYRLILRFPNAPSDAYYSLARTLLAKNVHLPKEERNWNEVEKAIDDAAEHLRNSPSISLLRAELLIAKDRPREAVVLLAETRDQLQKDATDARAQHQLVLKEAEKLTGEAREKKLAEAEELIAKARRLESLQPAIWQALVRLAERQRNWEDASRLLEAAENELGNGPQTRLMKVRHLVERYGAGAGPRIRGLLEDVDEFTPEQRVWLWRNVATLAYEIRDYETATDLCKKALDTEPDNLGVEKLRFHIAAARTDVAVMREILANMSKLESTPSAFWYYAKAMQLMLSVDQGGDAKQLGQALDMLRRAAVLRPKWGQVSLLAGMIHERLDDEDTAIDKYLEAIDLGVNDPEIVRRTAQLLARKNRLREADRMFRLLAEREPLLSESVDRQRGAVKARLGEFDAALGPARKVAAHSNEVEDHIWLGQLLTVVGRRMETQGREKEAQRLLDEAEEALRHAVILKSDSPDPWIALIQFLAQTEQIASAEKTIAQARKKLPPKVAATAIAQCYEVLDRPDEAAKQYDIAVKNAPRDAEVAALAAQFFIRADRFAKAKGQLVRIISGSVDATKQQKAQARRQMALTLSEEGGQKERQEAIRWIDANLAEDPHSATDRYWKAVLLANDQSGKYHREAITSLEKLMTEQKDPGPEVLFTLARLYREEGDLRKYRLLMDKLLKSHRDVPRYVIAYTSALIAERSYHEAEAWAAELTKLAPDDFKTVLLRAELAFQQRQFERTQRLLREYLNSPLESQSAKDRRLSLVAETFEDFARRLRESNDNTWAGVFSKEAYQTYREFVNQKPGQELLMASFLAKQERLDDAIDLIDSLWETSDPHQIAWACFAVIDGKGASRKQMDRVDRILQKAAAQNPNAMVIEIAIAVLRNLQDRFQEAEAIYRDILRKTPENPTVLNNLAVLLARHGVKLNEAADLIERAVKNAGPSDDLLDSRAIVHLALNHPERALEDLRKAIAQKPTPLRFFHQAEAFHACGQRKAAVEAFNQAVKMGLKEENLQGVEQRKFKKLRVLLH
ncbi:MAG: tetratricopeptide repeat protein [Pirellulales bacterium]|nr:tetratricopeptide repeat protein [Pirellulales bacterium]